MQDSDGDTMLLQRRRGVLERDARQARRARLHLRRAPARAGQSAPRALVHK